MSDPKTKTDPWENFNFYRIGTYLGTGSDYIADYPSCLGL